MPKYLTKSSASTLKNPDGLHTCIQTQRQDSHEETSQRTNTPLTYKTN